MCCVCVLHLRVNAFADSDGKRSYTQLNAPVHTSVFCIATAYMDTYLRTYMPAEVACLGYLVSLGVLKFNGMSFPSASSWQCFSNPSTNSSICFSLLLLHRPFWLPLIAITQTTPTYRVGFR